MTKGLKTILSTKSLIAHKDNIILQVRTYLAKFKNLTITNYDLGHYHMRLHNMNDAELRFRIVLFLQPEHFGALYGLAKCLFIRDKKEKALHYLEKALKLEPKNEEALYLESLITGADNIDRIPISMISDYFDNCANNYDEEFIERGNYRAATELAELLSKHITKKHPSVLDIGCGTGQCGQSLVKFIDVPDLFGVDVSDTMLKLAAEKNNSNFSLYKKLFHQDYNTFISKYEQKFDAIIAGLSLHYSKDLAPILKHLASCLNKNGFIAFSVEKSTNYDCKLNQELENFCYSLEYIEDQIKQSGLTLVTNSEASIKNKRTALLCICSK